MNPIFQQIPAGTRLVSMLLDHFLMTMIVMVFAVPGMISVFSNAFEVTHEQQSINYFGGSLLYVNVIGFALYFCKDCINGQSIAKRILKLHADRLGQYLTASIRVYDQVQNSQSRYVSLIFQLNENYLEKEQDFEIIEALTWPILLSEFPEKTFVWQIKYVYQTSNSIKTRIVAIGAKEQESNSSKPLPQ